MPENQILQNKKTKKFKVNIVKLFLRIGLVYIKILTWKYEKII